METGHVTTPFGRRTMTLAMVASQLAAGEIAEGKRSDKWQIFRALCEARVHFGVSDRTLAVLNALLSFHPGADLSEDQGLVVFPSNQQLAVRAHGMAPATLRRHLADLVDAGLITRKDSPNGKRYARKDRGGQIEEAFGLSLAPLLARAEEIEAAASAIREEQRVLRVLKERLSLCRRDIAKLIETGMDAGIAGRWEDHVLTFRHLIDGLKRKVSRSQLEESLETLEMMRDELVNILETWLNSQKTSANESQSEQHIQNSKTQSFSELEPRSEKAMGRNPANDDQKPELEVKSLPLAVVLQACPEIMAYGPGGAIASWRELMAAAIVVRSMLGVSPSAYQRACEILGQENAATVMACILERAGHINSAGGYLRALTARAEQGEFSLGPMVMALMRANGTMGRKTG